MEELNMPMPENGDGASPAPVSHGNEHGQTVEQRFLDHFGLSEQPFGITPDPRFLYLGPKHRHALAALNYGTELNRGFLTLIGQPGLGKTSLLFNYLEGLRDKARTAFVFQTDCDSRELMSYLLAELGLDATGKDLPEMHAILNQVLTEEMRLGRRFVLVIDEAQNLSEKVLESVRLLSNFETPWMKLMQIVLAGQPQLAERLAQPSLAQLQQRISFAIQIEPLSNEEVNAYVDHRLWVAGYEGSSLFSVGARTLLAEHSGGVPRKINNLCFCAMSLAWATKQKTIDREMMRDVLAEMNPDSAPVNAEIAPKPVEPLKPSVARNLHAPVPTIPQPPVPARATIDLSRQSAVQEIRAAVLTVKEPAERPRLPKLVFVCVVLIALGWSGVYFGAGKRIVDFWRGSAKTEKSFVAPAPVALDPADPANSTSSSPEPSSDALTDGKNADTAQPREAQSTSSSRDPN